MAGLSPEAYAAIAQGGLGVGEALLRNRQANADRETRMRELLAGITTDELDRDFQRQRAYMDTFSMDPVSQQRDLFSANILRDLAQRGPTRVDARGVMNPFQASSTSMGFLAPSALAENASRFYGAAGSLNPSAQRPNLGRMGFGAAGDPYQDQMETTIQSAEDRYNALNQQRRNELLDAIQSDKKKKGSGFWSKFLSIFGGGAPFAKDAIDYFKRPPPPIRPSRVGPTSGPGPSPVGGGSGADYPDSRYDVPLPPDERPPEPWVETDYGVQLPDGSILLPDGTILPPPGGNYPGNEYDDTIRNGAGY